MPKVRRYLLFFSVVAALAIVGDLIASELLRSNPTQAGAIILAGVTGLLVAVWIKEIHLARLILRLLSLAGLDLALLVILVASKQRPNTDQAMRVVLVAVLIVILLLRLRRHLTLRRVLGIVATIAMYLLMAIALLVAVYLAVVVGGIGVVVAYAIALFIAVSIAPAVLRARVIRLFAWVGVGSAAVGIALSLAGHVRDSAPHERGGVAVVVILSAFVIISLLRFHTVDALVARLGDWLRG